MELKELLEKLEAASKEAKEFREKYETEMKKNGVALEETKTALTKAESDVKELKDALKNADEKLKNLELEGKRHFGKNEESKSAGKLVVESEEFKAADLKAGKMNTVQLKAITSASTSAGALIRPYHDPEVVQLTGNRPIRIRDLFRSVPINSNSIEYVRIKTRAGAASVQNGELTNKAERNLVFELVSKPVATIAHWIPASRQVLSDAPQLQEIIDTELTYGLDLASDAQLLVGDGTGSNILGILNDPGINDIGGLPEETENVYAAMVDKIRDAVTECQKYDFYNVNGIVLNPVDFASLEKAKGTDGHYLLIPFAATNSQPSQIWRIPVVVTNAIEEGTFILGDWVIGATLYDREDASIRIAEQHADFFIKNGIVILAEERYALAVKRPKAFTKGSFIVDESAGGGTGA
jgi:HK97 family phage major capsid protein